MFSGNSPVLDGCNRPIGSQSTLCAGLAAVLGFVEPFDSHCILLEQFFDDIAFGVVKMAVEFGSYEDSEIPYATDKKHRVVDAVFLLEFVKKVSARSCPRFVESLV